MDKPLYNVGVIGCGLIGQKRSKALGKRGRLIACADINIERAKSLAESNDAIALNDWRELLSMPQVDIVIVSTLHDSLAEITHAAIQAGKNVLVEKPAARNPQELLRVIELQNCSKSIVRVGFNHRYHRALQKAKELVDDGAIGDLMFIRARYGHGARVGYEKEWRANKELSGGGELIDQGPHLIDLSRWFLGEFTHTQGFAKTFYWDMPVDDNAFMLLQTESERVAFLHVSCTEWKNTFSMEIYGKNGKLEISGLGGSYGLEKLIYYKMLPEMGPPETVSWEYPMSDNSWDIEMNEFYDDIKLSRKSSPSLFDAYKALEIIQNIYNTRESRLALNEKIHS